MAWHPFGTLEIVRWCHLVSLMVAVVTLEHTATH